MQWMSGARHGIFYTPYNQGMWDKIIWYYVKKKLDMHMCVLSHSFQGGNVHICKDVQNGKLYTSAQTKGIVSYV